ncbi:ATP-binding cassette domain-containing protein [Candidatus Gottesmanbacteria bacterium]|nr:ATP-binding cassette domain-containing protein [Candidatus Gottesmanbacteria bacterium]
MTAEVSSKRIEKPQSEVAPFAISPETLVSAARVAQKVSKNESPDPNELKDLTTSVGHDLMNEGLIAGKDDYKAVMAQAEAAYARKKSGLTPEPSTSPESPTVINMQEYRDVMGELFTTYKLGSGNWQTVTGIYAATDLAGSVIGGYQTKPWISEDARKAFTDKVENGLELLQARQTPLQELGATLKRLPGETKKKALGLLLSATWPWVAGTAHWFVGRQAEKFAHKLIVREGQNLQRAVNTRIAESLFMRDFEFLHDKPAGEIMEIINNGKLSTIDLVRTTYTEFLPTMFSILSQLPRQYVTGKLEFASTLIKMPFLLMRSEQNAKLMQKNRAAELARMDKVNTKLMTTLAGLESVRTSGSATSGADSMLDLLTERDTVASKGLRQKLASQRQMNMLFDAMDVVLPFMSEAIEFNQKRPPGKLSGEGAFNFGVDALSRVINSKNQQMEMRAAFAGLTRMYVDNIIPDIQDIRRMEELLGKYDTLDRPNGPKERARIPVTKLANTDIHIENLSYKGIVRNVSLDIPQGSFVTIKGESGTGKTTFIRNLVGLYTPESGTVAIGGIPIDGIKKYGPEALATMVGYANQNPQILEGMTLKENLLLWSHKNVPDTVITKILKDLRLEHLQDRLDTTTKHFSGGELRRIGIARALLKNPKILVLDEPTASLDEASAQQVMDIIQRLRKERPDMTVVAITHDPVFENISEKIIDFEKINIRDTAPRIGAKPTLSDHQVLEAIARPKR